MNVLRHAMLALLAATALAACKVERSPDDQATTSAQPASQDAPVAPPGAAAIPAAQAAFDLQAVPVSTTTLGPFPFIALPEGYMVEKDATLDYARFPFWYGNDSHWVEGRFYQARLQAAPGKQMSRFELKKNFEALVRQIGGVQVAEGKLPYETTKSWGSEVTSPFYQGLSGGYEPLATIWVVRRNDGNVWLQLNGDGNNIGYVVGQEQGFAPTASLLQAGELKRQIEQVGKVDVQVNFATDQTQVLPDSMPQIAQMVQLLNDDPSLKLAVNGHTDNTGDKAHNQTLSTGRATSVVKLLTDAGVDASRLQAAGYGDSRPVADNGTEAGKAKNRRVELVKQ